MTSTVEERFQAAVNVIKGLPKNGSYQPSNAMMLTFYSYYKQATQGPCKQKKPNFWDIVGKAKWDAWMALGEMSRERAMELYVEELKKIIETMSYTENVANFMGSIDELDNVNLDDLETVAPEIMKKARSHPNSPFASRGSSPNHIHNGYSKINDSMSISNGNYIHQNGVTTIDQSDDEYTDTVEDNIEVSFYKKPRPNVNVANNNRSESSYDLQLSRDNKDTNLPVSHASNQILQQILTTVQKMNNDVVLLNQRINVLEKHLYEVKNSQTKQKVTQQKLPLWWPIKGITPTWFIILILWPFIIQNMKRMLQKKK